MMQIYMWFVTGMLIFLFLFFLLRLILRAGRMKIVGKILSLVAMVVILFLLYFMLTRVLGVFEFKGSTESLNLPFLSGDSSEL